MYWTVRGARPESTFAFGYSLAELGGDLLLGGLTPYEQTVSAYATAASSSIVALHSK
jgi:hypothetical protein